MAPPSFVCCKLSVSVGALLRSVMRSARPKGRPGAQETIKEFIYTQFYFRWQTAHVLRYPNTGADVQVLGNNLTKRMYADLFHPHPRSGAFLDSCW